jgi:hypothetical protein
VIQTLASVINQGVDIQLKVLQTVLSLLTHCNDIHGEVLGEVRGSFLQQTLVQTASCPNSTPETHIPVLQALLLCFKLHDVKIPVVSSTAAATLRQAVMLVFDRVTVEDRDNPPSSAKPPGPCASDAIDLFHDLCVLTAGHASRGLSSFLGGGGEQRKARMLKLGHVSRTFGFELIESVLGGFEDGVKRVSTVIKLWCVRPPFSFFHAPFFI